MTKRYDDILNVMKEDMRRLLEENDDDSYVRDVVWEKSEQFEDTGMYTIYLETDDGRYILGNTFEYDEDWIVDSLYNILKEEKQRFIENCSN